jgi:chromate transport protein ChrA
VRQTVRPDLGPLAALVFKLGCLGFGGPAAHLALMEREQTESAYQDHFLVLFC